MNITPLGSSRVRYVYLCPHYRRREQGSGSTGGSTQAAGGGEGEPGLKVRSAEPRAVLFPVRKLLLRVCAHVPLE